MLRALASASPMPLDCAAPPGRSRRRDTSRPARGLPEGSATVEDLQRFFNVVVLGNKRLELSRASLELFLQVLQCAHHHLSWLWLQARLLNFERAPVFGSDPPRCNILRFPTTLGKRSARSRTQERDLHFALARQHGEVAIADSQVHAPEHRARAILRRQVIGPPKAALPFS